MESLSNPSHSRESGNPPSCGLKWTPAYAGVTAAVILISIDGPQAHAYSLENRRMPVTLSVRFGFFAHFQRVFPVCFEFV
jgi:hypothetical protein